MLTFETQGVSLKVARALWMQLSRGRNRRLNTRSRPLGFSDEILAQEAESCVRASVGLRVATNVIDRHSRYADWVALMQPAPYGGILAYCSRDIGSWLELQCICGSRIGAGGEGDPPRYGIVAEEDLVAVLTALRDHQRSCTYSQLVGVS